MAAVNCHDSWVENDDSSVENDDSSVENDDSTVTVRSRTAGLPATCEVAPLRRPPRERFVLLVGCLTSQQHASVSQGRICSDNFTCCHTEIEVADPTFYLTRSQYTDTGPTSPSADPITPGAWQGSHWSANV